VIKGGNYDFLKWWVFLSFFSVFFGKPQHVYRGRRGGGGGGALEPRVVTVSYVLMLPGRTITVQWDVG